MTRTLIEDVVFVEAAAGTPPPAKPRVAAKAAKTGGPKVKAKPAAEGKAFAAGANTAPQRGAEAEIEELLAQAFDRALDEVGRLNPELLSHGLVLRKGVGKSFASFVYHPSVMVRLSSGATRARTAAATAFFQKASRIFEEVSAQRQEAAIAKLADVLLPDPLAEARGVLAADNLELRDRFVAEEPVLTAAEVGTQAGLALSNPYATAARWKKTGAVFSVNHRGRELYPAFQFRDGRPHPTIKAVLAALPRDLSPWETAFWFVSSNGWLEGRAPRNVLDDVAAVTTAAQRERDEVVG
jgi:hypothetical protein